MPASKPASGAILNANNPGGFTTAWFLSEGSGTTATDAGTNELVGTLTNSPTWATGGLNFDDDGTRQCVTVTSVAPLTFGTGDFTIAIGYEREEPDSSVGIIWCLTESGYFNGILISIRPSSVHLMFPGGAWCDFSSASAALTTGSVHHAVFRADRDGYASLYHNGSYLAQTDISSYSDVDLQPTEFTLGGNTSHIGYGDNWNWEGKVHYAFTRAGMPSETVCASVSGDPYLDMAGDAPTGRPMYLLQQVRQPRSTQSVRVRSF